MINKNYSFLQIVLAKLRRGHVETVEDVNEIKRLFQGL